MPLVNNLRVQVDKPVWEWCTFAPAGPVSIATTCIAENSKFKPDNNRYIYAFYGGTSFWRFDTWTNSWQNLANPVVTPFWTSSMRYIDTGGFKNRVISATSTTLTAGIPNKSVLGQEIRILSGTGRGQRRVITAVDDPVAADTGSLSSAGNSSVIDSAKAWAFNQWVGYIIRPTFGAATANPRKIIYNNATTLTFQDIAQYPYDDECNPTTVNSISGPYAIESTVITVDTAWDVTPDATSRFVICTGSIISLGSVSATPFYVFQQYDIATDTWYNKPTNGAVISATSSNDNRMCHLGENNCLWERGKATSGSATTLVDTSKGWTTNQWVGYNVRIFSGTGRNTIRAISANTGNTLTIANGTALDNTSYYVIEGYDSGIASSGSTTTLVDSTKAWATNRWRNSVLVVAAGTGVGQTSPIASNTGTTLTLSNTLGTALDSTSIYYIRANSNHIFVAPHNTTLASLFSLDLEADMNVPSRSLDFGVTGTGTAQYADHPARAISTGTVAANVVTITTTMAHNFRTGMSITHRGDTGASAVQNNITATITVTGTTTYTYPAPSSVNNWVLASHSSTTLIDASKNWATNQWAGQIVTYLTSTGLNPTWMTASIVSNTATTLTFSTATTVPTNVLRYIIHRRLAFGGVDSGVATGTHSTTTLQDTSKSWTVNQWAGRRVRLGAGHAGTILVEALISSNTSNTLTFGALGAAPVSTLTTYTIMDAPTRNTGQCFEFTGSVSNRNEQGRFITSARGASLSQWDKYDLSNDIWQNIAATPLTETYTSGTYWAYDGVDRIYGMKDTGLSASAGRAFYLDLRTNQIHAAGTMPYVAPNSGAGNTRMEVIRTADGLVYLWMQRNSSTECFMSLCFF